MRGELAEDRGQLTWYLQSSSILSVVNYFEGLLWHRNDAGKCHCLMNKIRRGSMRWAEQVICEDSLARLRLSIACGNGVLGGI